MKHLKTFERAVAEILSDFENKKFNKYKANTLIQEQLKYCNERDEKIRKEKLEISINAGKEINKS